MLWYMSGILIVYCVCNKKYTRFSYKNQMNAHYISFNMPSCIWTFVSELYSHQYMINIFIYMIYICKDIMTSCDNNPPKSEYILHLCYEYCTSHPNDPRAIPPTLKSYV